MALALYAPCASSGPLLSALVLGSGLSRGSWEFLFLLMLTSAFHSFSEEERTRFRELLASPSYRASPLLAIGRQLAHQMQLEGGDQL